MKVHSFIRENYSRAVQKKLRGEGTEVREWIGLKRPEIQKTDDWPTLEQFVYFMFCPSFIYRDEYPR